MKMVMQHLFCLANWCEESGNLTSDASSANLTNLEQDTQYDVTVSPYIEGFQLGPPTNIIVNTSSLGDLICSSSNGSSSV